MSVCTTVNIADYGCDSLPYVQAALLLYVYLVMLRFDPLGGLIFKLLYFVTLTSI